MRPGQSCPGVGKHGLDLPPGFAAGFNEAGAIMPRSGRSAPEMAISQ